MQGISDRKNLLANMKPVLNPGRYAFVDLPLGTAIDQSRVIASVREPEGLTVIVSEETAQELSLPVAFVAAWITLAIHSELAAVGFTSAFSRALARWV